MERENFSGDKKEARSLGIGLFFKILSKPSVCILAEPGKNCTKLVIKSAALSAIYGKLSCPNDTLQYEACGRASWLETLQELNAAFVPADLSVVPSINMIEVSRNLQP